MSASTDPALLQKLTTPPPNTRAAVWATKPLFYNESDVCGMEFLHFRSVS